MLANFTIIVSLKLVKKNAAYVFSADDDHPMCGYMDVPAPGVLHQGHRHLDVHNRYVRLCGHVGVCGGQYLSKKRNTKTEHKSSRPQ